MSITVDTNVLVYASNEAEPWHVSAKSVLDRLAAGPEIVVVFWPVLLGYLRIVTHPAILPRPLTTAEAMSNISAMLDRPHVRSAGESTGFWQTFTSLATPQVRGNDVPDTHLVALMRDHGVRSIYTRDRGFRRFDGLDVRDLPEPARFQ